DAVSVWRAVSDDAFQEMVRISPKSGKLKLVGFDPSGHSVFTINSETRAFEQWPVSSAGIITSVIEPKASKAVAIAKSPLRLISLHSIVSADHVPHTAAKSASPVPEGMPELLDDDPIALSADGSTRLTYSESTITLWRDGRKLRDIDVSMIKGNK